MSDDQGYVHYYGVRYYWERRETGLKCWEVTRGTTDLSPSVMIAIDSSYYPEIEKMIQKGKSK